MTTSRWLPVAFLAFVWVSAATTEALRHGRHTLQSPFDGVEVCEVTGFSGATGESVSDIDNKTTVAISEAVGLLLCKGGEIDLAADSAAKAISQAYAKAVAKASVEITVSPACDKGSGGSGYADAISKAYAQATATAIASAITKSFSQYGGDATKTGSVTKDVQTNVSTTLGKATASAEQWAVGTANVQTMVVAEAVASALAVSIANSFQYIKEQAKDKSACSVDVQSEACSDGMGGTDCNQVVAPSVDMTG